MIREEIGKITAQASWDRELSEYTKTKIKEASNNGEFSTTLKDNLICGSELSYLQMLGFTVQRCRVQGSEEEEWTTIISWYNYHPTNEPIIFTKEELKRKSDQYSWNICKMNDTLVFLLVNAAAIGEYSITIEIEKLKEKEKIALINLGYKVELVFPNYLISWN